MNALRNDRKFHVVPVWPREHHSWAAAERAAAESAGTISGCLNGSVGSMARRVRDWPHIADLEVFGSIRDAANPTKIGVELFQAISERARIVDLTDDAATIRKREG